MGKIRVWKLGNLEHSIFPSQELVQKLENILKGIKPGETADIVWTPDIEVIEVDNNDGDVNIVKNG